MNHFQITFFTIGLIILVLLAAFFSCAETALLTVNRYRLRYNARMRKGYALRLTKLLARPDRLLGAILIGNTFASMLASSLATLLAYHFWGEHGALLAAILLAIIVLVFAEITPKTIAALYPEKLARWVVLPVYLSIKILYPLVWIANLFTNFLLRLLHINIHTHSVEPLTRDELRSIVYDTTGKISRQYQNMLLSILDLSKLTVDDVMTPRHEMQGLDLSLPLNDIIKTLSHIQLSYVPLYMGLTNQVIGVVMLEELFKALLVNPVLTKEMIEQLMVDAYFVPSKTTLTMQLAYFQQSQDKLAFVVDEYGEILGCLTIDNILEEIVGNFTHLADAKQIKQQIDGSYLVEGTVLVREFNRLTGWELPQKGPRTINGLIVEYLQTLPRIGTCVLIAGYPLEIIQTKDNRVKSACVFPKLRASH